MPDIKFNKSDHSKEHSFEYNQIDDNIFIGTNMCCVTHFDKDLIEKGITVDVSLEEENMDHPEGVKMFLWLPTKDHTPPTPEQLQSGVDFLASIIKQNQKVYVHCQKGHGRAPTLVTAYYMSTGLTLESAIEKIQEKRPSIHLEENQLEALKNFSETL